MLDESTLIASYRVQILLDVIAREGFEFSTAHMHYILTGADRLRLHIYRLRAEYSDVCSAVLGYSVLFAGCRTDTPTLFADRVYDYYEGIGALDYYRGMIDA